MSTPHPVIVTITGPSGSGKTVLSHLLNKEDMKTLVSTTTRAPRQGEQEGKDYHFMSRDTFNTCLAEGKFIENIEYNGVLYGVSVDEAEKAFSVNKPAVLVADPHGVEQIKKFAEGRGWSVLRVFVDNPENILVGRLLNRLLLDATNVCVPDTDVQQFAPWVQQIMSIDTNTSTAKEQLVDILNNFVAAHPQGARVNDADVRVDAAAHRLRAFQFEQKNWVEPARTIDGLYDYITTSFDQSVQQTVVAEVLKRVQELQLAPALNTDEDMRAEGEARPAPFRR